MKSELLRCPLCGGKPYEHFVGATTHHYIECKQCGCRTATHVGSHGGSAKDDWNIRANGDAQIESASAAAIHAIRKILDELGVPKAAFIDDHVMNGLAWARKQGLEEAAKVVDDFQVPKSQNDGDLKPRRYPSQASIILAAAIRKCKEPSADD